jgi:hypothetical protein
MLAECTLFDHDKQNILSRVIKRFILNLCTISLHPLYVAVILIDETYLIFNTNMPSRFTHLYFI